MKSILLQQKQRPAPIFGRLVAASAIALAVLLATQSKLQAAPVMFQFEAEVTESDPRTNSVDDGATSTARQNAPIRDAAANLAIQCDSYF